MNKNYRYHPVDAKTMQSDDSQTDEQEYIFSEARRTPRRSQWLRCLSVASHIIAWTLVFLLSYDSIRSRTWGSDRFRQHKGLPAQLTYSPAQDSIEYEVRVFKQGFEGREDDVGPEFSGPPSDELDKAWSDLYNFGVSAISKEEASYLTNKTSPIPGSEQYIVELDVMHQLHCLNRLRKALNPFYFCPRSDPHCDDHRAMGVNYDTAEDLGTHLNHCLHSLRQSLMCHADVSPVVWHKSEKPSIEGTYFNQGFLTVAHTCRNFDKIKQWAIDHQYHGSFDMNLPPEEDDIVIPVFEG